MADWNEDEVRTLRTGIEMGKTFGEIAKEIPRHSRNSVIGKAHRLGLTTKRLVKPASIRVVKKAPSPPPKPVHNRPPPTAPKPIPRFQATEASPGVPDEAHKSWMCTCILDDGTRCSGPKEPKSSWCEFHRRLFVTPPQPRRYR